MLGDLSFDNLRILHAASTSFIIFMHDCQTGLQHSNLSTLRLPITLIKRKGNLTCISDYIKHLNRTKGPLFLQFHFVGDCSRTARSENPPHSPQGCFQLLMQYVRRRMEKVEKKRNKRTRSQEIVTIEF